VRSWDGGQAQLASLTIAVRDRYRILFRAPGVSDRQGGSNPQLLAICTRDAGPQQWSGISLVSERRDDRSGARYIAFFGVVRFQRIMAAGAEDISRSSSILVLGSGQFLLSIIQALGTCGGAAVTRR
jgi:hypothetical protein